MGNSSATTNTSATLVDAVDVQPPTQLKRNKRDSDEYDVDPVFESIARNFDFKTIAPAVNYVHKPSGVYCLPPFRPHSAHTTSGRDVRDEPGFTSYFLVLAHERHAGGVYTNLLLTTNISDDMQFFRQAVDPRPPYKEKTSWRDCVLEWEEGCRSDIHGHTGSPVSQAKVSPPVTPPKIRKDLATTFCADTPPNSRTATPVGHFGGSQAKAATPLSPLNPRAGSFSPLPAHSATPTPTRARGGTPRQGQSGAFPRAGTHNTFSGTFSGSSSPSSMVSSTSMPVTDTTLFPRPAPIIKPPSTPKAPSTMAPIWCARGPPGIAIMTSNARHGRELLAEHEEVHNVKNQGVDVCGQEIRLGSIRITRTTTPSWFCFAMSQWQRITHIRSQRTLSAPSTMPKRVKAKDDPSRKKPGVTPWATGTKLAFLARRQPEWKVSLDRGGFYDNTVEGFCLKYGIGFDLQTDIAEDTPDPDPTVTPLDFSHMSEEEVVSAKKYVKYARSKISQWFRDEDKKVKTPQADFAKLFKGHVQAQRKPPTSLRVHQFYSKVYYATKVRHVFESTFNAEVAAYEERMKLAPLALVVRNRVTRECWENEPESFKELVRQAHQDEKDEQASAFKSAMNASDELVTPEDYDREISTAALYLQPIIDAIHSKLGLVVAHSGKTHGYSPSTFPEFNQDGCEDIERILVDFTKNVYTQDECDARALPGTKRCSPRDSEKSSSFDEEAHAREPSPDRHDAREQSPDRQTLNRSVDRLFTPEATPSPDHHASQSIEPDDVVTLAAGGTSVKPAADGSGVEPSAKDSHVKTAAGDPAIHPAADGSVEPAADGSVEPAADGSIEPATDGSVEPAADGSIEPAADGSVDLSVKAATDGSGVESAPDGDVDPALENRVGCAPNGSIGPAADGSVEPSVKAATDGSGVEPSAKDSHVKTAAGDPTIHPAADGSIEPATDGSVEPAADGSVEPAADGSVEPAADGSVEPAADGSIDLSVKAATDGSGVESAADGDIDPALNTHVGCAVDGVGLPLDDDAEPSTIVHPAQAVPDMLSKLSDTDVADIEKGHEHDIWLAKAPEGSPPHIAGILGACGRGRDWGCQHAGALAAFIAFEKELGYPILNHGRAVLVGSLRPSLYRDWVSRKRPYKGVVGIKDARQFGKTWWTWWQSMQPHIRVNAAGALLPVDDVLDNVTCLADWGDLDKCCGKDGLIQFLITLLWWGDAVNRPGMRVVQPDLWIEWESATQDFREVVEAIMVAPDFKKSARKRARGDDVVPPRTSSKHAQDTDSDRCGPSGEPPAKRACKDGSTSNALKRRRESNENSPPVKKARVDEGNTRANHTARQLRVNRKPSQAALRGKEGSMFGCGRRAIGEVGHGGAVSGGEGAGRGGGGGARWRGRGAVEGAGRGAVEGARRGGGVEECARPQSLSEVANNAGTKAATGGGMVSGSEERGGRREQRAVGGGRKPG
ncbi:hypothetical protein BD626DRAFT_589157 [Schizophyllum amplum]|uniref:Uncharacterized protein n=1 Tax=Schizophyllum amplum TaxID=97359 RepID=A0A550BRN3_9AGAR|nr:hypothetical protein BD626DRAFT_589157 [Auriculariopsis ampla]